MTARSRARYLAPVALVATIAGAYLVAHSALDAKTTKATPSTTITSLTPAKRRFQRTKYYTVQPGDNLTSIATKTGVPLATLEALNRSVQPDALQTGQRLRLRR